MKNPVSTFVSSVALATIAWFASPAAYSAVIAYEGFDYTESNGTALSGLNGGTGWDEAYPSVTASGGTYQLADGLSFTGHLASTGKSTERTASATLTTNGRNWDIAVTTGTYWYSFLMNPTATASTVGRGTFGILQNGSGTDNQNGFGIRYDFTGTAGPGATLIINANTPAQAPGANISFVSGWGLTYLVVGRLTVDTAANTINDIWVYQNGATLPTDESGLGTIMSTSFGATAGVNPAIYGRAFGGSAPTFFDEVRIGTTLGDVMVVPEPSAAVLGLIGLTALLRRRR